MADAEVVNDEWPNKHIGSHFFVKRLIELNPNIGAYDKDGRLMGWSLRLQSGPLGALQVQKQFARKGIGSLVANAMCKILANMQLDTFALVGAQNFPSQKLFEKLGFEHKDDAYWLRTLPLDRNFKWSDESEVYY